MPVTFRNEPLTPFAGEAEKEAFRAALGRVRASLGASYAPVVGGRKVETGRRTPSVNPAEIGQIVGNVHQADAALAEQAVQAAAIAYEGWRQTTPGARARCLYKAAAILRRRKHEFSAWMVFESGKTWAEADADTAEAIDFMEFYGREAERLAERQPLTHIDGEDNELAYIPLGVGIVIPPWNFPLAILAGMTTAAIVCGNTVVVKPATPAQVIAARFCELLEEAGVPAGVVNYLPGPGAEIGDYLVDHPLTRFVSFTGSREIGLRINERAAKHQPGQRWIKRVVAEMGGKDAIVVDADSNLDAAAAAIAASAFGFAGQKCSACSRAIVLADVYEDVLGKVAALTRGLKLGAPVEADTDVGPVIDDKAYAKIRDYIDIGRGEGRLIAGGGTGDPGGYYLQPTIFADVARDSRLAQEEIFGPVLAFLKASTFDEALAIANETDYGLTGAVFSRSRARLEQARAEFHAGNLYLNRKCTGALVGVHPFGGFNLSGTDSKAGGRDYLLLFSQAKVVSEKL
ncbi:L-glutamate gamma-semialdehyde dehydrogenase [Cohnella nanjingensis]|uniref:L-glutamate gamma-semialdehyde dehydrogenase n=1 Tax=Cohnella nanjingensis TaxID=1387779 RepID=A0A7X0RLV6_9BACL|nr:L-glutamate gamma-semialdehyde dehydrogenase [Cohnella nanjingensis]MBB6669741.1 L-glutamate gamma-semialdehyde dehydrogenase [Cohnella nanjingensis]